MNSKVKFNNYIPDHEIKIHDEVIDCFQDYINLGQEIGACTDHEK